MPNELSHLMRNQLANFLLEYWDREASLANLAPAAVDELGLRREFTTTP